MSYHVFYQLEILPYWTSLILQRFGEAEGPATPELEVTETELDWFEQGLLVAAFYHPVAIARMQQLQKERRPARNAKSSTFSSLDLFSISVSSSSDLLTI